MPKHDLDPVYLTKIEELFPYLTEVRWNDAGELFATSKTVEYLDFINKHPVPISSVSTSLTLTHRYMEELFSGGITHLSVSVDGATGKIYESIRQGASFDRVMENLRLINETKIQRGLTYPHITLVFISMKRNIHELPDFVDLAKNVGAENIHVLRLLPGPERVELEEQVDPQVEKKYYALALDRALKHGIELKHVVLENKEFTGIEHSNVEDSGTGAPFPVQSLPLESNLDEKMPYCLAPWQEVVVGVEGEIRPCCFMEREMGHLKDNSFLEIWNGERYQDLRSKVYHGDLCYCRDCPWVRKFFSYYRPRIEQVKKRWETLLQRMGQYTDLDNDCCPVKYGKFHPGNDELYHLINQYWKVLPQDWEESVGESGICTTGNGNAGTIDRDDSYFVRMRRKLFNWLNPGQDKNAVDQVRELFQKQQQFNAVIVQYLNLLSERFNTVLTRQIHFNQETSRTANISSERIDHTNNRVQGIQDIIFEQTYKENPGVSHGYESLFYKAEYKLESAPGEMKCGIEYNLDLSVSNRSLSTWLAGNDPGCIGVSTGWFDHDNLPVNNSDRFINLEENLAPGNGITVQIPVETPASKGSYTLIIDLECRHVCKFSQRGILPLKIEIGIV